MIDLDKQKKERAELNARLDATWQAAKVKDLDDLIKLYESDIEYYEGIALSAKEKVALIQESIEQHKKVIKELLESLEASEGHSRVPSVAHLSNIAASYDVVDIESVPAEFIKTKVYKSLDKTALKAAIEAGQVDIKSNWLKVKPAYKTVVLNKKGK